MSAKTGPGNSRASWRGSRPGAPRRWRGPALRRSRGCGAAVGAAMVGASRWRPDKAGLERNPPRLAELPTRPGGSHPQVDSTQRAVHPPAGTGAPIVTGRIDLRAGSPTAIPQGGSGGSWESDATGPRRSAELVRPEPTDLRSPSGRRIRPHPRHVPRPCDGPRRNGGGNAPDRPGVLRPDRAGLHEADGSVDVPTRGAPGAGRCSDLPCPSRPPRLSVDATAADPALDHRPVGTRRPDAMARVPRGPGPPGRGSRPRSVPGPLQRSRRATSGG